MPFNRRFIVLQPPFPLRVPSAAVVRTVTNRSTIKSKRPKSTKKGVKAKVSSKRKGGKKAKGKASSNKTKYVGKVGNNNNNNKKKKKPGPTKGGKVKKSKISPIISKGHGFGTPSTFKEIK